MIKIAYAPEYQLSLPKTHRFPMEKYGLIYEQLLFEKTFAPQDFFHPRALDRAALLAVHDEQYVEKMEKGTLHPKEVRRIGFPWSKQLMEREMLITSGTVQSSLYSLENGIAFNVAGGTHHAYRDKGEGFCIYNDIAVAAQYLLDIDKVKQALIVDLDVHQGNGTARIFEKQKSVFTFSMHSVKNYPLHKENSDLDIGLSADISDQAYLRLLEKNLKWLIETIKPDIIFYQSGVDILENDRLGKLSISKQGVRQRDIMLYKYAAKHAIPVTVSMGGGYARRLRNIVDAHCNTFRLAKDIYE